VPPLLRETQAKRVATLLSATVQEYLMLPSSPLVRHDESLSFWFRLRQCLRRWLKGLPFGWRDTLRPDRPCPSRGRSRRPSHCLHAVLSFERCEAPTDLLSVALKAAASSARLAARWCSSVRPSSRQLVQASKWQEPTLYCTGRIRSALQPKPTKPAGPLSNFCCFLCRSGLTGPVPSDSVRAPH
jgi:hypothetical protein